MYEYQLLASMPRYYRTSNTVQNLAGAYEQEAMLAIERMQAVCNQRFVDSADFSLKDWEQELAIKPNETEPAEQRRSKIVSKLRGQGTVTIALIKNVAESYANSEVEVTENPTAYSFTVKFVGNKGIPPNMADLKVALEDCKPAHLAYAFSYTYNTWDMVAELTWQEATQSTWEELRVRTISCSIQIN